MKDVTGFGLWAVRATVLAAIVASLAAGRSEPMHDTAKVPAGMVLIPRGTFHMGLLGSNMDESPVHAVTLDPYLIDRYEVTNREFGQFVAATGHVTQAERDGYAWCFIRDTDDFQAINGANWRHPAGPESSIDDLMDHTVVCVSWEDASAYARWAGKRLPTEAEWEYAARGGSEVHFAVDDREYQARMARGESASTERAGATKAAPPMDMDRHGHDTETGHHDEDHEQDSSPSSEGHNDHSGHSAAPPDGRRIEYVVGNTWQGTWPTTNEVRDGYFYTAPVGRFEENGFGVHDMIGNVWEWTADWYGAGYYSQSPSRNPVGPDTGERRGARGGSWFCSPNYCGAYSTHYRGASPPTHTFNNVGFRCAADIDEG